MTQGKAAVFETDMILFPVKTEQEILVKTEETEVVEIKKGTLKIDIHKRFARLRKNIKKRSASIF